MVLSALSFSACGGGSSDSAETSDNTQTQETADAPEGVAGQFYILQLNISVLGNLCVLASAMEGYHEETAGKIR